MYLQKTEYENNTLKMKLENIENKKRMDNEEEKKSKIFNSIHINKKDKKRYFRVEKNRFNASTLREKESKKIFKTQKEYHFSKRKEKKK